MSMICDNLVRMTDQTMDHLRQELAKTIRRVLKNEAGVDFGEDGKVRLETPAQLVKDDGARPWVSSDGLSIPRKDTVSRKKWDKRFEAQVQSAFGGPLERVRVPVGQLRQRNPAVNSARLELYSSMVQGKDELPPAVVQKLPDGSYFLLDGNHRYVAAQKHGLKHLDAFVTRGRTKG